MGVMPACGSTISDSPVGSTVLVEVAGCVLVGPPSDVVVPFVCAVLVECALLSLAGAAQPAAQMATQSISPNVPSCRDLMGIRAAVERTSCSRAAPGCAARRNAPRPVPYTAPPPERRSRPQSPGAGARPTP